MKRDLSHLSLSAAARALQSMGKLEVVHVTDAKPVKSLRQACIERGVDPDNTGYKGTKQRLLNLDRIIPGVPDRISPCEQLRNLQPPHPRPQDARRMYPRNVAEGHKSRLEQAAKEGALTECYVALFCQLNNLIHS